MRSSTARSMDGIGENLSLVSLIEVYRKMKDGFLLIAWYRQKIKRQLETNDSGTLPPDVSGQSLLIIDCFYP